MLPIITKISDVAEFKHILKTNPGVVILKFGAPWCGPCKLADKQIHHGIQQMPNNVQCYVIDIDEYLNLYSFLKNKRVVGGIPCLLAYYQGNDSHLPDEVVSGHNSQQIDYLFSEAFQHATNI